MDKPNNNFFLSIETQISATSGQKPTMQKRRKKITRAILVEMSFDWQLEKERKKERQKSCVCAMWYDDDDGTADIIWIREMSASPCTRKTHNTHTAKAQNNRI